MLPVLRNHFVPSPFVGGPVNRLDSWFDRVFGEDGDFLNRTWSGAPVAMWEDDDRISIEAELPGVAEEDIEVTVHNGMLFIRGERKPEEGRRYLYNGRTYGRFERVVSLPEAVNTDDVQATLSNGVLRIDLPKSPEAKPKRITLKTD
jgi:HSP20 family protein